MCLCVLQNIDTAEAFFSSEVFAHNGNQVVEALLLQACHLSGKLVKLK